LNSATAATRLLESLRSEGPRLTRRASTRSADIHLAFTGDYKAARTREVEARAKILEAEHAEKSKELIHRDSVMEKISEWFLPIRQRFEALSSELAHRVNPADPSHTRKHLDGWTHNSMRLIQDDIRASGKTKEQ
jgi:hypothetical protein